MAKCKDSLCVYLVDAHRVKKRTYVLGVGGINKFSTSVCLEKILWYY